MNPAILLLLTAGARGSGRAAAEVLLSSADGLDSATRTLLTLTLTRRREADQATAEQQLALELVEAFAGAQRPTEASLAALPRLRAVLSRLSVTDRLKLVAPVPDRPVPDSDDPFPRPDPKTPVKDGASGDGNRERASHPAAAV